MKRLLSALVFALMYSVFPSQCSAQFQNHFSIYTTQSLDDSGTLVNQTVTIDGYTQVPPQMPIGNAVHTPHCFCQPELAHL
jgi:hypothetical protein